MEVYVDDLLVKSKKAEQHLADLRETCAMLREYKMKLNPHKCAFGVESGKFLGFMVSDQGIKANPEKIRAIMDMPPPRSINEVQKLTGRAAALGRFIARSIDRCLPFFSVLRKAREWDEDCGRAFNELKEYLGHPSLLSQTTPGANLTVYLAVSPSAVSSVLTQIEVGIQRPVYYVNRAFRGAEARYPRTEMLAFALVVTARRLRPHFQAHPIKVQTDVPLRKILQKPDISSRMTSWAIELSEFEIEYLPRTTIEGQVLADFVAEFTNFPEEVISGGAGVHIVTDLGERFDYALKLKFKVTNNEAEYEALMSGLRLARSLGTTEVEVKANSQIVEADRLAKAASGQEDVPLPDHVVAQIVDIAAVGIRVSTIEVLQPPGWATDILRFLQEGIIHNDREEAGKVRNRAARFTLVEGILYKRGYTEPLFRCISSDQAQYMLAKIHKGVSGNHVARRTLALRTARARYYWPNAHKDAEEFARKCLKCQENAPIPHCPPAELTSVNTSWPFAQ
ncbi:hypothetical protein F2P56_030456 [Juglans regia]|uniref:Uncharacterized protein LOC108991435 n=2 Tax=Juglans regia TaxID=51240 RepID=A0A2I4EP92_JUGRE|nr:uncharacterized protein LOC108991435 [Juglans regia]KAF5450077.1 hypothetical protein F2P56_030456 [Juglans regia]